MITFFIDSVLKHCAANRKRRLSALPNLGPYIYMYTTLKFLALQGAPNIYISRLRVKLITGKGKGKLVSVNIMRAYG
jgi:hypothetical protein